MLCTCCLFSSQFCKRYKVKAIKYGDVGWINFFWSYVTISFYCLQHRRSNYQWGFMLFIVPFLVNFSIASLYWVTHWDTFWQITYVQREPWTIPMPTMTRTMTLMKKRTKSTKITKNLQLQRVEKTLVVDFQAIHDTQIIKFLHLSCKSEDYQKLRTKLN